MQLLSTRISNSSRPIREHLFFGQYLEKPKYAATTARFVASDGSGLAIVGDSLQWFDSTGAIVRQRRIGPNFDPHAVGNWHWRRGYNSLELVDNSAQGRSNKLAWQLQPALGGEQLKTPLPQVSLMLPKQSSLKVSRPSLQNLKAEGWQIKLLMSEQIAKIDAKHFNRRFSYNHRT